MFIKILMIVSAVALSYGVAYMATDEINRVETHRYTYNSADELVDESVNIEHYNTPIKKAVLFVLCLIVFLGIAWVCSYYLNKILRLR